MYTITLDSADLRNALADLAKLGEKPRGIVAAAIAAVRVKLIEHFAARNQEPNKLGGRKTNFWEQILQSTQITEVTDRYGVVSIGDARFAQKVFGGKLVPKNASALTIPLRAEAHGRSASVLETEMSIKLFVVHKFGKAFLAAKVGSRLMVFYLLAKSVTQKPDPRALPPMEELESVALEAAQEQLTEEIRRIQPT